MAGPTSDQRRLIAETEYHIAALDELLTVYEFAMRKAVNARRRDPQHIAWLAGRIEYTASMLLAAQDRRTALTVELHVKDPAR
jgi:hypothetical protein